MEGTCYIPDWVRSGEGEKRSELRLRQEMEREAGGHIVEMGEKNWKKQQQQQQQNSCSIPEYYPGNMYHGRSVFVLHIKPFFIPVDIHHTQCPCRFVLLELQALWSQNHDTEIPHCNEVSRVDNAIRKNERDKGTRYWLLYTRTKYDITGMCVVALNPFCMLKNTTCTQGYRWEESMPCRI